MLELSVIIAYCQDSAALRTCLAALARQTLAPARFEVLVVTAGVALHCEELTAEFAPAYRLTVIGHASADPGALRNRGAQAATGRFCLFLDADTIAEPGLLAAHLRVLQAHDRIVTLGCVALPVARRAGGLARYHALAENARSARLQQGRARPSALDCSANNMALARAAFRAAGGFAVGLPHAYGVEFGYRLEERGFSFGFVADAVARQRSRQKTRTILAGAEGRGADDVALYRQHPALLARLALGQFSDLSLRLGLVRRLLLHLRLPVGVVAAAALVLGRGAWGHIGYHFLYTLSYWRGVRQALAGRDPWPRLVRGPVILMYHALARPGEPPGMYVVTRRRFAQQMAWLRRWRYHVLGLEEYLRLRRAHRLPRARSVIITFDDGYADNRAVGYPVLRHADFPATIFLVSQAVGDVNRWTDDPELSGRPLLSWPEIRALRKGGMQFGAHTRTHPPLTAAGPERLAAEVAGCRADLEAGLGAPVLTFAYPHGKYDAASAAAVAEAGFLGACGTYGGLNDPAVPIYALRRVEVRGSDSLARFALALATGRRDALARLWRGG